MQRSDRRALTGFGLAIHSDCAIPGTLPDRSAGDRAPDLRIATLPPLPDEVPPDPVYRWADGTLTFAASGVGRYACRPDAIHIAPTQGADPEMVTALLIATALPAAMWLRGDTMLHAAGVIAPGRQTAIAIAGPSGVGKSLLTAQLLDGGGTLLADDTIRLQRRGDGVEGSGLPGGYHRRMGDDRDFVAVPSDRSIAAAPIAAVVILAGTDRPPALIRLSPVAAIERLLANLHRPAIPALLGRRAPSLATMAFMAEKCAVYEWHRPMAALGRTERDLLTREGLW